MTRNSSHTPAKGGALAAARATPERTCIVCRQARPASELLRLACTCGVVAPALKASGRGAWVCARGACVDKLSAAQLSRALKQPVAAFSLDELLAQLEALAQQRVLEMVGLARRANLLCVGAEAIAKQASPAFTLLAADATERVRAQVPFGRPFVQSQELSRAAGLYNVFAVSINPGPLALQAAYWLSMWYECRSRKGQADGRRA